MSTSPPAPLSGLVDHHPLAVAAGASRLMRVLKRVTPMVFRSACKKRCAARFMTHMAYRSSSCARTASLIRVLACGDTHAARGHRHRTPIRKPCEDIACTITHEAHQQLLYEYRETDSLTNSYAIVSAPGRRYSVSAVCRHDLGNACARAAELSVPQFDIFHTVGQSPEAEAACNVQRSAAVLGMRFQPILNKHMMVAPACGARL